MRILVLLLAAGAFARGATYYIDDRTGDDRRTGTDPAHAWATLEPANRTTFRPGDSLLLRAGGRWRGQCLHPLGSGTDGLPIVLSRYGDPRQPPPELDGAGGVPAVLQLDNQEGWEISDLEITNPAPAGIPRLCAVQITAHDAGILSHLYLRRLTIHDVNGPADRFPQGPAAEHGYKMFGGVVFRISGTGRPTAWNDVRIEDCSLRDCSSTALVFISSWVRGHRANDPKSWVPSHGVVVRGDTFERSAQNALIVRACVAPLIEHNLFRACGVGGTGNACYAFDCDDAVFQYNEACFTRANPGDADASGFDSDWNCRRTVIQYNYSHDNDYGFLLICCRGDGFNEGTIVRGNVSRDDNGNLIRVSGTARHTLVCDNVFFVRPDMRNRRSPGAVPGIVMFKSWRGWADDTVFRHNVVFNESPAAQYLLGSATGTRFESNCFYGLHPASEPSGAPARHFDIPSGPAERTLDDFSRQADVDLAYAADQVRGVATHAVRGDMPPVDALDGMLSGTPLSAIDDLKPGAFAIKRIGANR